uniref:phosphotransferase enzyme family protein n=1 Tax=Brachybacterium sp. GPGPB12 TaxID=3023517 RepID=UPI00404AECCE
MDGSLSTRRGRPHFARDPDSDPTKGPRHLDTCPDPPPARAVPAVGERRRANSARERFGFADVAEATDWLAATLREHWALTVRSCRRLTISDHNVIAWVGTDGADLVVKWSREDCLFPRLEATTGLITHLADQGVPVAAPVPARDGTVRVAADGPIGPLSVAVLPEIDGTWLDVDDLEAVRTVGVCLARMHEVLGGLELPASSGKPPRPPRERVRTWLEEHDHGRAPSASHRLAASLQDLPDLLDTPRLVHGDVRAANLLMQGGQVAAVLDLDEVRVDHRIAELAQSGQAARHPVPRLAADARPRPTSAARGLRAGPPPRRDRTGLARDAHPVDRPGVRPRRGRGALDRCRRGSVGRLSVPALSGTGHGARARARAAPRRRTAAGPSGGSGRVCRRDRARSPDPATSRPEAACASAP